MDYIKIFYDDEENNKKYINNFNDYNQLLSKIEKHEVSLLNIIVSSIEKNNLNKVSINEKKEEEYKNNYESDIINSIYDYKKINNKKNENKNEIIYPVMCSICKKENLNNIIYFCLRCKNYVCSNCFDNIKYNHSHSYNIIMNKEQYLDIKEIYNNYIIGNV